MCYKCKLYVDIRDEYYFFDILVLFFYLGYNGFYIVIILWICVLFMYYMFYWIY